MVGAASGVPGRGGGDGARYGNRRDLAAARRRRLDRDLAVFMPDPALLGEPDPDEGPVLVTLTYTVEDDQVPAFVQVMGEVRRSRLRTGASSCEPSIG